ncbi:MAG: J domain-containing protein, partial [Chloroflexota bacterium]
MAWIIYMVVVLAVSIVIGLHLGRFRIAYTEMSGMMLGMTMGMLNGFLLGYAAAALSNSMFWGNLFGILLGLGLGIYYGRAGGLMGVLDGGMGGVMGGSMGAMLAVMLTFPQWAQGWTIVLLTVLYVLGMAGLVALIEQSAPDHAALHRLLPMFTRAMAREAAEEVGASYNITAQPSSHRRLVDYYVVLGVPRDASYDEITEAYLDRMEGAAESDQATARIERALVVLSDPEKRQEYDGRLQESDTLDRAMLNKNTVSGPSDNSGDPPPARRKRLDSVPPGSIAALGPEGSEITLSIPSRSTRVGT